MRQLRSLSVAALLAVLGVTPALAHPHIFVDLTAELVFDGDGRFAEIRQRWTFDEAFSAWVTQGLDADGDGSITPAEMQDLADENLLGLGEFEYYTFAGEGQSDLIFRPVGLASMHIQEGRVVMDFAIAPTKPYAIRQALEVEVTDPDYYVAFTFPGSHAATLIDAPAGCTVEAHAPRPLSDADAVRLAAIGPEQVALPADLKALVRDQTNIILVSCPPTAGGVAPEPETALDAIAAVTSPVAAPFGGPPPERTLPMPKSGFLGWINEQQKAFYVAMSQALAGLRDDRSAFLILGLLSFLYGVFHAAGPGHGKVVVSGYVLAGERMLRRGIALSFASALAQSLSAILFVLVAAALLEHDQHRHDRRRRRRRDAVLCADSGSRAVAARTQTPGSWSRPAGSPRPRA